MLSDSRHIGSPAWRAQREGDRRRGDAGLSSFLGTRFGGRVRLTEMLATSELLDHAADVARHLVAFESYRGSQSRAVVALRRRAPGFSGDQYERALSKAIQMFKAARKLVADNMALPSAEYQESGFDADVLVQMVSAEQPGFPRSTYVWVVDWIDLYYHQM